MENTKSKITVNLYGNKYQAVMPYSDPTLDEIVSAFVGCLESHDFTIGDIHRAMIFNLLDEDGDADDFKKYSIFADPDTFKAILKGSK